MDPGRWALAALALLAFAANSVLARADGRAARRRAMIEPTREETRMATRSGDKGATPAPPPLPATPTGFYRHYKGGEYAVLGAVRHSESLEVLVLYRALYGERGLWVRPHAMFFSDIEIDGRAQPRFAFVSADLPPDAAP